MYVEDVIRWGKEHTHTLVAHNFLNTVTDF